jgi:cellulose synthase/poly-beta-1,6-N-acetylglucosamine synthase-like glycosyltransferase
MLFINVLLITIFLTTAFTVVYSLIFSVGGLFASSKKFTEKEGYKKMAILLPAYKEDAVILDSANHALFQQYPSHMYDVVVIADSLQPPTIERLRKLPIKLIEVNFEESTKAKALNAAFDNLKGHYDVAVVLDADNLMKADFLSKINAAFYNGCYAVQGHRIAKNLNTRFAVLDGLSEEINNHIFRKGQQALGFSSSIIGSGMAFSYLYLKQVMAEINAVGGFDKELELKLIEDNHRIVYLEDAYVLDEKVQRSEVYAGQRTRWISAQLIYLKKYFVKGSLCLFFGKTDYANKVAHYAMVPKVLLMGFLFIATSLSWFAPDEFLIGFSQWGTLTLLYLAALILAIPAKYYNFSTAKALTLLPFSFLLMFIAVFKLKGANKNFIHTPHTANFENAGN